MGLGQCPGGRGQNRPELLGRAEQVWRTEVGDEAVEAAARAQIADGSLRGSPTRTSSWSTSRAPAVALRDLAYLLLLTLPSRDLDALTPTDRAALTGESSPGSRTVRLGRASRSSRACSCMRISSHRGSASPKSLTRRRPMLVSCASGGADTPPRYPTSAPSPRRSRRRYHTVSVRHLLAGSRYDPGSTVGPMEVA